MYKVCPRCGASLDPGERCDCGTLGSEIEAGGMRVEKSDRAAPEVVSRYIQDFRERMAAANPKI